MRGRRWLAMTGSVLATLSVACGQSPPSSQPDAGASAMLTHDQLVDPATCATCHVEHYKGWSGSMHAYAADDPVFLAMNARGQRETKGALGSFCVRCHAPVALAQGLTTDGLNLPSLPQKTKGVTCYVCHSIDDVGAVHDASFHVASDDVIRGPFGDPAASTPHKSAYSPLHDRRGLRSSDLCGSCHQLSNPGGVPLQRTYAEWQGSLYGHADPSTQLTCGNCHMNATTGKVAAVGGLPDRELHDHMMVGVDVALSPFAETSSQRAAVKASLDTSLVTQLCTKPGSTGGTEIDVSLDDAFAAHDWPSGAAYHRRAWVELHAYSGTGASEKEVWSSGVVADGEAALSHATSDATMFHLGDRLYTATGDATDMLWNATREDSSLLGPAVTADTKDPRFYHAVIKSFAVPAPPVDRVTMVVKIRPVDVDLIDALVSSGDIAASVRANVPTFTLAGSAREWKSSMGYRCVP